MAGVNCLLGGPRHGGGGADVEAVRRPRCCFLSYYYAHGAFFAAADLATSERQLLVCSVCVWEEGTAVSQLGFGVWRRRIAPLIILSFLFFLVSLYIALMF